MNIVSIATATFEQPRILNATDGLGEAELGHADLRFCAGRC
jgi:hypothetical protein